MKKRIKKRAQEMQIQEEAERGGRKLPKAEAASERSHRKEEDGAPRKESEKEIQKGGPRSAEPPPRRAKKVIGHAERQTQEQRPEQLPELGTRIDRHVQPKSRDQRPPLRAGSS